MKWLQRRRDQRRREFIVKRMNHPVTRENYATAKERYEAAKRDWGER